MRRFRGFRFGVVCTSRIVLLLNVAWGVNPVASHPTTTREGKGKEMKGVSIGQPSAGTCLAIPSGAGVLRRGSPALSALPIPPIPKDAGPPLPGAVVVLGLGRGLTFLADSCKFEEWMLGSILSFSLSVRAVLGFGFVQSFNHSFFL